MTSLCFPNNTDQYLIVQWENYIRECSAFAEDNIRSLWDRSFKGEVVQWAGIITSIKDAEIRLLPNPPENYQRNAEIRVILPESFKTQTKVQFALHSETQVRGTLLEFEDNDSSAVLQAIPKNDSYKPLKWLSYALFSSLFGRFARNEPERVFNLVWKGKRILLRGHFEGREIIKKEDSEYQSFQFVLSSIYPVELREQVRILVPSKQTNVINYCLRKQENKESEIQCECISRGKPHFLKLISITNSFRINDSASSLSSMSSYFSSVPRFMPFPLSTATQSSFYNVPGSMSTLSFNSFANEKKPSSPDISMARAQNQKSSAPFPSTYNPSILNFSAFSPSEPKFATSEQLSSHNSSSFSPSQLDIDAVTLKNDDTKMEKEIEMEREKEVEIEKEKEKEKEKENENENEMTLQSNSIKLLPSVPSSVFSASSSLSGPSINSSPSSAVVPSSLSLPHSDRIVGKPLTPTSIENFSFLPPPPFSHQHPSNQTPPQPSASSAPSSTTSNFASISARPVSSDVLSIQTRQNSVTSANASEGPSNNSPSSVSNSAFQPFQLLLTPPPSLPLPPPPLPQNKELAVNNKIESDVSTEENDLTIRKCHLTQKPIRRAVVSQDGFVYDLDSVREFLSENAFDPSNPKETNEITEKDVLKWMKEMPV